MLERSEQNVYYLKVFSGFILSERSYPKMEENRSYEAPKVRLVKFDENDILRTSGTYNCSSNYSGNDRDVTKCDMQYHTDNTRS